VVGLGVERFMGERGGAYHEVDLETCNIEPMR